jgi:hypothetical protein
MSNLVPDSSSNTYLYPKSRLQIQSNLQIQISDLEDFLIKQQTELSMATDEEEINKLLERISKIAEILRNLRKDSREEISSIMELNERFYNSEANMTEAKSRNVSIKVKQILGIFSIPSCIAFGAYSYIYLQQPSLGLILVIFGLSGGLLTLSKDDIKSLIPQLKFFNDSQNK